MSKEYLGLTFDVHGGGQDLIFPHHENEIAQSTCAHGGTPFVRTWVHNGYVMVEGEKMSKSLGNFYTVHDLLEEFPGEAIRLALLQTHYRQPLDFTKAGLAQARQSLRRFYTALRKAADIEASNAEEIPGEILTALKDDLNTPLAISHLNGLLNALNKAADARERVRIKGALLGGGKVLGLLQADPEAWLKAPLAAGAQPAEDAGEGGESLSESDIESLIEKRAEARISRDFAEADRIRDDLAAKGVILEDGAGGTTWRRG
jgi:cysteinyl-tRNA synthetase